MKKLSFSLVLLALSLGMADVRAMEPGTGQDSAAGQKSAQEKHTPTFWDGVKCVGKLGWDGTQYACQTCKDNKVWTAGYVLEKAGWFGMLPDYSQSVPVPYTKLSLTLTANQAARYTGVVMLRGARAAAEEVAADGVAFLIKKGAKKVTGWNEVIAAPAKDASWFKRTVRSGSKLVIEEMVPYLVAQQFVTGPLFAGWDSAQAPTLKLKVTIGQ